MEEKKGLSSENITILGGGGFLGSHLARALLDGSGCLVRVVDRSMDKLPETHPRLEKIEASINDGDLVDDVVGWSDIIVSATAICNPAVYNTDPTAVIHANFTHIEPLVRRCARRGNRLIHFSTCEVYGHPERSPSGKILPMNEDATPLTMGPISMERWSYAAAKQLLERLIHGYGRHEGLDYTIVRPFNVIGPRMDYMPGVDGEGTPRVLACFMRSLLFGEPMRLVDGGRARRAFSYVSDFTDAVVRIVERPEACRRQIINIGCPDNDITIRDLAMRLRDKYAAVCKKPLSDIVSVSAGEFYGEGYEDVERRIPDIAKARALLDWEPRTAVDEMLEPIIEDYVARYADKASRA